MKNRHIIVAALTLVVLIAAVIVSQQRAPQTSREKTPLFPELAGKINEVDEISVYDGRTTLTIRRAADKWRIADADDYPALIDEVKQTVLAVSDLQVISGKTTNPELYKKLGVEPPEEQGATSHLLTIKSGEEALASLIVGNSRRSRSPSGAPGLYVRLPGEAPALLVEGRLSVSADVIEWIERNIIDIEADRVSAIHLRPEDGPEIHIKRDNPEDDLVLQNIPEGKEQQSEYLIGRMAALLENIYVEGVRNEDAIDYSAPDTIIRVTTFDGLSAQAQAIKSGEHTYARFSFTAEPGRVAAVADESAGENGAAEEEPPAEEELPVEEELPMEEEPPTPEQEAENLNRLVRGWAYQLSESKAELFGQSLADLVRDPDESEEEQDGG